MLLNLKKILNQKFKDAKKIAVLGVGSDLRADDAAGILIAEQLKKEISNSRVKVFLGATAPENLTGEIIRFKPTHLLILDSADISAKPGTIEIIDVDQVRGISFSTHQMPFKVLVDYILNYIKCSIFIIGIQPKSLKFGGSVSKEVLKSVKQVSSAIIKAVGA